MGLQSPDRAGGEKIFFQDAKVESWRGKPIAKPSRGWSMYEIKKIFVIHHAQYLYNNLSFHIH